MVLTLTVLLLAFLGAPSAPTPEDEIGAKVEAGLDAVLAAQTQDEEQEAFDSIVALGCHAVPQLVDRMDDRRKLPVRYLRLDNDFPGAFEAFRQYSPEVVTDAVAAILNQITAWDCGFIFNGASEEERVKVVECWRQHVRDTPVQNCGRKQ